MSFNKTEVLPVLDQKKFNSLGGAIGWKEEANLEIHTEIMSERYSVATVQMIIFKSRPTISIGVIVIWD